MHRQHHQIGDNRQPEPQIVCRSLTPNRRILSQSKVTDKRHTSQVPTPNQRTHQDFSKNPSRVENFQDNHEPVARVYYRRISPSTLDSWHLGGFSSLQSNAVHYGRAKAANKENQSPTMTGNRQNSMVFTDYKSMHSHLVYPKKPDLVSKEIQVSILKNSNLLNSFGRIEAQSGSQYDSTLANSRIIFGDKLKEIQVDPRDFRKEPSTQQFTPLYATGLRSFQRSAHDPIQMSSINIRDDYYVKPQISRDEEEHYNGTVYTPLYKSKSPKFLDKQT